jgi:hypothetical protein
MFAQATIPAPRFWLFRLPEVFDGLSGRVFAGGAFSTGHGYWRIATQSPEPPVAEGAEMFIRWMLPVHHAWPCDPEKTAGFIEKAATAMAGKFGTANPAAVLAGAFDPWGRRGYFRKLASNLRGRTMQLLPKAAADAESLGPGDLVLFAMVGRNGLFCGLATPRQANGFHPGGSRFIRQAGDDTVSRAGAKIAEALYHVRLLQQPPPPQARWLELGASPGGMTAELLRRGHLVTAIDRAPLAPVLDGARGLDFRCADVSRWSPPLGSRLFGALLCDMNGPPELAARQIARMAGFLSPHALVVFTFKTTGLDGMAAILARHREILAITAAAGLRHLQTTHLTYNRREFTCFFSHRP